VACSTRTGMFSTQPRAACAGQSIDGEVVWRAGLAVADGEPSFRGRDPFRERKALTTHPRRYRSNTTMARVLSERIRIQLLAKSLILRGYDILARHRGGRTESWAPPDLGSAHPAERAFTVYRFRPGPACPAAVAFPSLRRFLTVRTWWILVPLGWADSGHGRVTQ
jgi:hypothetical protein